ncbi:MAG: PIN domain-containing protein [Acidimicrobiales bacterium]
MSVVLDAGGVRRLAERSTRSLAVLDALGRHGLLPLVVPSVVLVECLSGDPAEDAAVEQLLAGCRVVEHISAQRARRAAWLRTAAAGRGTTADALVVALAEPGGAVLTNRRPLEALALYARDVFVERV